MTDNACTHSAGIIFRAFNAIKQERKPLGILTLAFVIFYWKFFLLGQLYIPADILNHWYQPWHERPDLREQFSGNRWLRKMEIVGDFSTLGPVISRPGNPDISDPLFTFLPEIVYDVRMLKAGELPLWNETQLGGIDQLGGDISFSFAHPLNLIYFIPGVSVYLATSIRILLFGWLSGVFFFFLMRDFNCSRLASIAGAITYMFSSHATTFLEFITYPEAYAYNPALYLLYRLYLKERDGFLLITGALAVALIILTRNPKPISYILAFFILYQLANIFWLKEVGQTLLLNIKRTVIFNGFALIMGISLSMVITLPMVKALGSGPRIGAMPFLDITMLISGLKSSMTLDYWQASYPYILTIFGQALFPNMFGSACWMALWSPLNYIEYNSFIGFTQLAIVSWLFFASNNRKEWYFLGLFAVVFLTFALIPPFRQLFTFFIPNTGWVRLAFIYSFLGAVLTSFAVDKLRQAGNGGKTSGWRGIIFPVFIILLCCLILGALIIAPGEAYKFVVEDTGYLGLHSHYERMKSLGAQPAAPNIPMNKFVNYHIVHFSVILLLMSGSLWFIWKPKRVERKFLFITLIFLNLAYFGMGFNPTIKDKYICPDTNTTKFIRDHIGDGRLFRTAPDNLLPAGVMSILGVPDVGIRARSVTPVRNYRLFKMLDPIGTTNPIVGVAPFSTPSVLGKRIVDAMNIKYVATTSPWSDNDLASLPLFKKVWAEEGVTVYENHGRLPRVFLTYNAVSLDEIAARFKSGAAPELDLTNVNKIDIFHKPIFGGELTLQDKLALTYLASPTYNPKTQTLVEGGVPLSDPAHIEPVPVRYERVSNHEYRYFIPPTTTPSYLYVADSFFPGWTAYIDGASVNIIAANYIFRAVYIQPGGERVVTMRYVPRMFYEGAAISVVSLIIIVSFAGWLLMKRSMKRGEYDGVSKYV